MSLDAFDNLGIDWKWRKLLCILFSRVLFSSSRSLLSEFSSLFHSVKSWVNMRSMLSKTCCWALEVYSCAFMRWWRFVVISYVNRYKPYSHRADGSGGGVTPSFLFIIRPLEEIPQWCWWYSPCRRRRLSIVVGYCYPGASTLEETLLFCQNLS